MNFPSPSWKLEMEAHRATAVFVVFEGRQHARFLQQLPKILLLSANRAIVSVPAPYCLCLAAFG